MRGPADHAQVQHQRRQSTMPDASLQQAWFRSMKNVLEEIDESLKCIGIWPYRFLDLGYELDERFQTPIYRLM